DVGRLLRESRELFEPVAKKKEIRLTVDGDRDELSGSFDFDRIFQALSNLLGNAIRFTPPGGSIEVTARRERDEILVSVRDTGPGIPLEKQESIFDRFS